VHGGLGDLFSLSLAGKDSRTLRFDLSLVLPAYNDTILFGFDATNAHCSSACHHQPSNDSKMKKNSKGQIPDSPCANHPTLQPSVTDSSIPSIPSSLKTLKCAKRTPLPSWREWTQALVRAYVGEAVGMEFAPTKKNPIDFPTACATCPRLCASFTPSAGKLFAFVCSVFNVANHKHCWGSRQNFLKTFASFQCGQTWTSPPSSSSFCASFPFYEVMDMMSLIIPLQLQTNCWQLRTPSTRLPITMYRVFWSR
jgi:hypothetical protein